MSDTESGTNGPRDVEEAAKFAHETDLGAGVLDEQATETPKATKPPADHFANKPVEHPVEVFQRGMRTGFIPIKLRDFREAWQFAAVLVKSGLLPTTINTAGKALAVMLTGQEIGIPPMTALRMIHVIDGRPSLSAELMLAKFRVAGGTYEIHEHTHERCKITFEYQGSKQTAEWGPEDTQRAGLLNQTTRGKVRENWKKYPKRMCLWRTVDNGLSILAPEIFLGMHTQAYAHEAVEYEEEDDSGQRSMDERIEDLQAAIDEEQAEAAPLEEAEEDLGLCKVCDKPLTEDNRANEKICLACATDEQT